jgi:hypothetical protein
MVPGPAEELAAESVATRVASGRTVRIQPGSRIALQKQEKQEKEEPKADEAPEPEGLAARTLIRLMLAHLGLDRFEARIAAMGVTGFVLELVKQLGPGRKGVLFLSRILSASPKDALRYTGGYALGLVEGIISPITDLFGLAVFGEHLRVILEDLLISAINRRGDLTPGLRQVQGFLTALGKGWAAAVSQLKKNPQTVFEALLALPDKLSAQAERMAYSLGRKAGAELVASLEAPWEEKKEETAPAPSFFRTPLARISHEVEELHGKVIESPWAKIGNKVGYVVGFAAINIVMLVFTDGLGNLITKLGNALGKISKAFGALGRGVKAAAGVLKSVGAGIEAVEKLIAAGISKVLKPLESVLEPVLRPFAEFLEGLKKFLKNLFGVVEKEAAPAVTTVTTKGAAALAEDVTKVAPKPTPPHVPSPSAVGEVEDLPLSKVEQRGKDILEVFEEGQKKAPPKESFQPSKRAQLDEAALEEAEALKQRGIRENKPLGELQEEAKEGKLFDTLQGQKYPKNQVPIRDKLGEIQWLDSYDPVKNEIISRKSLAGNRGQIAFTDEFTMIEHFQEFQLKYPNGKAIADVPSARKLELADQILSGKYVLEVPVQEYEIPERILHEAEVRGITIRDINGKIYKSLIRGD